MSYDRVEIDTSDDKGRIKRLYDTLAHQVASQVETVTRRSRFEISGGSVDQVDAPDDLDELVALAKTVGFVWKAFDIFAQEVWEPGYRVEAESDATLQYFMGDMEDIEGSPPEDTPEGGFLANAGVYAGERHQDFFDIGKEATRQRWLRGTVLIELMKANPESPDSEITGFYHIRPETVSAEVYPNTNILIDPEDTDVDGVETTKRGEAAAYIQFDDNSILGRRGAFSDTDEIPLSQNDVHKQVLNPGIGDDVGDNEDLNQGVFGTSALEPVKEDIAEYRNIKRDESTAIGNKSHGMYFVEHGREVLDLGNGQVEVIEWDDDSMDDFEANLDDLEPGGFITHDGSVTPERVDGEVPDLASVKENYINDIFSALPISKFKVGFEDNINRDVTSEQSENDKQLVSEAREYQERQWTQVLRTVANRKGLPTEGLELKIEPEPSDSPIKSLTTEEIDNIATYAQALSALAGPQGGPQTLVDADTLLTEVAQLPESATEIDDIDPEETENPDAMSDFLDIMERDTLQAFDDGEVVTTPDGLGVIDDIITSGTVDGMEASEDNPVYAVVVENESVGVGFYREDELDTGGVNDLPGPENPEDEIDEGEETDTNAKQDAYQEGFFEWPQSWVDSETPARIIALKAWAGMGGSFDGCVREMRGELTGSPNRFCADFKDRLYGTEKWRGGWAD